LTPHFKARKIQYPMLNLIKKYSNSIGKLNVLK